ncbi:putative porin [Flavobacterium sp.]|uniref:putative porin n=1 Tax=Flavobacterium sp. TaxID=239 RepID=UPI002610F5F1|nr:putative porin [Flavobacterium sp.]MDD2987264.1 putative porin [Flavobacterium sp.]
MKGVFLFFFIFLPFLSLAQEEEKFEKATTLIAKKSKSPIATIDQYKIITIEKDSIVYDTSLTIHDEYRFNYLRKDNFGLMPFPNEGQPLNTLDFGLNKYESLPKMGFAAKHFNYLEIEDINYYSVATPLTELYFKTVMEQGQSLDAFITLNSSEQFNVSIAYKGLRSLGKYVNQLTSNGNFRFTTSYHTKNKRYILNGHFTAQDLYNEENGGIINNANFEDGDPEFKNRARLQVYLTDANSFLKGNRYFIDQRFRINPKQSTNNLFLDYRFIYEHKFFEFIQTTIPTTITSTTGNTTIYRFGDAYVLNNLSDQTRFNEMKNKVGAVYENTTLGEFKFFLQDVRYNYYYNRVIITDDYIVPNRINDIIQSFGGEYSYRKNNWKGLFSYTKSITDQNLSDLSATIQYSFNPKNTILFKYQNLNRIPDLNYTLFQSSYINYNWYNNFKNEKINSLSASADTQWGSVSLELTTIDDFLYYSNDDTTAQQVLVTPKQYGSSLNYFRIKVSKEFKWWKLALDNTFLFQGVDQTDDVLNVPQFTTRNTLYFSNHFFKKALFLQTGITFNFFTNYYANDYNPIIAGFYTQNNTKTGDFPLFDFFVNAKISQAQIYLKAEHFNSAWTGFDYYAAPNYPYHDFMIRFGVIWNFFL